MDHQFENRYAYYLVSNHIIFLEIKENVVLDHEVAAKIASDRMRIQEGRHYPVLLDLNGLADSSKTGRDYLAHYGWYFVSRVGILVNLRKPSIIAKFYLQLSKPAVPSMIFSDRAMAVQFLEGS